ncbi:hypothetical protein NDU88_002802 [Pleurodeles waltl]|uniref:Uncharacterized protein n=1 Tax=Pleurodeles waltl TaxID=8319 RepID=A0AAV7KWP0_PLEWA|nr:hypothetical protein NDU88_002802 [Pleurodeles waltl]
MEQLPHAVGTRGGQSHPARARTATLVPGLRVGHQAAGSSHLFHFQRAPSGTQGSIPGSSSCPPLHTGSGDVRVKVQHCAFSFRFSRSPGLRLSLPGLDCAACGNSSQFPHLMVSCTCSVQIAPDLRLNSGFPTVYLSGDGATSPRGWHAWWSVASLPGLHSKFGPQSQGGGPGRRLLGPVPLPASTLGRSRQRVRFPV